MGQSKQRIAIFGAGGHGKVAIDAVEHNVSFAIAFVIDDHPRPGAVILGHQVAGGREVLLARRCEVDGVIVAIGDNPSRKAVVHWLRAEGFALSSVIHPAAVVARTARIYAGTLVLAGAIVNADARIGANVIINTGAIVEHDCLIDDDVHVGPRATLCGGAQIGAGALIGAGAVILPGVNVGVGATVGAGALVLSDVPQEARAVGIPARWS